MNPLGLLKAEYVFRPRQALKRLFGRSESGEFALVTLPWGMPLRVRPGDDVGRAVLVLGVLDLPVTETLWRLTDPHDVAVDAGANVGAMTAVLAARAPRVWAFEPHPALVEELRANVARWKGDVRVENVALSRERGVVALETPLDFERNRGVAHVSAGGSLRVEARTLDDVFGAEAPAVLKLDVEGHELAVLEGGKGHLAGRRIRDIVFEEHRPYPSDVTRLLEGHGYELFRIGRGLLGPRLLPASADAPRSRWEPTSFLATADSARARERLRGCGWRALRRGR